MFFRTHKDDAILVEALFAELVKATFRKVTIDQRYMGIDGPSSRLREPATQKSLKINVGEVVKAKLPMDGKNDILLLGTPYGLITVYYDGGKLMTLAGPTVLHQIGALSVDPTADVNILRNVFQPGNNMGQRLAKLLNAATV